jgi:hypothetical protein
VVQERIEAMMEQVNRDTPEEKLDDFLDRSLYIQQIISTQHGITMLYPILSMLAQKELALIYVTHIATAFLNINMLMFANDEPLPSDVEQNMQIAARIHFGASVIFLVSYFISSSSLNISIGFRCVSNIYLVW